jgi:hypothetical protein
MPGDARRKITLLTGDGFKYRVRVYLPQANIEILELGEGVRVNVVTVRILGNMTEQGCVCHLVE